MIVVFCRQSRDLGSSSSAFRAFRFSGRPCLLFVFNFISMHKMADERVLGRFSSDYADHRRDKSHENGLIDDEADFSDPEEFVDEVTDDGLSRVLIL